jgi:hypothetical protein
VVHYFLELVVLVVKLAHFQQLSFSQRQYKSTLDLIFLLQIISEFLLDHRYLLVGFLIDEIDPHLRKIVPSMDVVSELNGTVSGLFCGGLTHHEFFSEFELVGS